MNRAQLDAAARQLARDKDIALCTAYRWLARRARRARQRHRQQQQQSIADLERRRLF